MKNALYIGLSRQAALRTNMEIIANNVANVNTPGFRAQKLIFAEYIANPRDGERRMSFVVDKGQFNMTEPGTVKQTGNPYDAALEGPGFFGVKGPDGQNNYTRGGNFQVGPEGKLLTAAGFEVLSAGGGGPIEIPGDSTEIKIDEKGVVSNQNGELGQLMVVEFEAPEMLRAIGNNLYSGGVEKEATETRVMQGHLEGSNVKGVVEMTRMIDTLRSYKSVQNILQTENDRLRSAIQKLSKV